MGWDAATTAATAAAAAVTAAAAMPFLGHVFFSSPSPWTGLPPHGLKRLPLLMSVQAGLTYHTAESRLLADFRHYAQKCARSSQSDFKSRRQSDFQQSEFTLRLGNRGK
jgi:hypothetical protein